MKKLLFCFLILVSSFSYAATNPRDDTPQEALDRINKHYSNQLSYDRSVSEVKASISKNSAGRTQVKQMLERSGVLEDGSKVRIGGSVTKPVDTAKAAKTLADRLANAKDYAKKFGKASIPSFVGMAAFEGLMNGIDWVMGEGGQVQKSIQEPDTETTNNKDKYSSLYQYTRVHSSGVTLTAYDMDNACSLLASFYASTQDTYHYEDMTVNGLKCEYKIVSNKNGSATGISSQIFTRVQNPYYQTAPQRETASDEEIEQALKNALESNNPALAAAIAEALKNAYSPDKSEGQNDSSNSLVKAGHDDISKAIDQAFKNPTPTSTPEKPAGYYKISDGDKTIEGYVTPAPVAGTTDTTTTPTIDPVTGQPTGGTSTTGGFQLPAFCDWAAVVCDFIDWVKEEPEIDDPEVPFKDIQRQEIRDDLLTIGSTACPADIQVNWTGLPFGISIDKTVEMRPYCDVLEPLKYVFSLLTICLCAFMFLRL